MFELAANGMKQILTLLCYIKSKYLKGRIVECKIKSNHINLPNILILPEHSNYKLI